MYRLVLIAIEEIGGRFQNGGIGLSSFDLTRISFFIISCNCQGIQLNQILKRLYSYGDKAMNNGIELFVDDKSCMKRPSTYLIFVTGATGGGRVNFFWPV